LPTAQFWDTGQIVALGVQFDGEGKCSGRVASPRYAVAHGLPKQCARGPARYLRTRRRHVEARVGLVNGLERHDAYANRVRVKLTTSCPLRYPPFSGSSLRRGRYRMPFSSNAPSTPLRPCRQLDTAGPLAQGSSEEQHLHRKQLASANRSPVRGVLRSKIFGCQRRTVCHIFRDWQQAFR